MNTRGDLARHRVARDPMTPPRFLKPSRLQPLGVVTTVRRELHRLDIVQALSMLCETRNMNVERTSTPIGVHIK
jgi:hypothetical protein